MTNTPASEATNGWSRAQSKLDLHPLTFGLDQVAFLHDNTFLEQPLWKYAASLVYIALAFAVAWLMDIIINVWLKRWTSKIPSWHDDWLLDLLRGPVKVVVFVIFLNIGLNIFEWPDRAQLFLSHAFIVVVSFSVTYVVLKLVDLMIGLWRERIATAQDKVFADQLVPLMSKAAKVSILIIAGLLTADNLNIRIGSALAGLSIGGLALGLAAQDTVANLFGAVAIFLDKPFNIGDRIKILSVDGTVESIGLRSTRVRNLEGHHVTIPNKTMGNEIITNITRRPGIKTELNIGLTYETPVEKVRQATLILQEILGTHPRTNDLIISFNRFADSALNIFVVHTWSGTDVKAHFADMQEMNLKIKERFDAEKIDFAFPSQTIYLKAPSAN
jgi:MscS family membrane protein